MKDSDKAHQNRIVDFISLIHKKMDKISQAEAKDFIKQLDKAADWVQHQRKENVLDTKLRDLFTEINNAKAALGSRIILLQHPLPSTPKGKPVHTQADKAKEFALQMKEQGWSKTERDIKIYAKQKKLDVLETQKFISSVLRTFQHLNGQPTHKTNTRPSPRKK